MSAALKDKNCVIAIFDNYVRIMMQNECRDAVDEERRKWKREDVGTDGLFFSHYDPEIVEWFMTMA